VATNDYGGSNFDYYCHWTTVLYCTVLLSLSKKRKRRFTSEKEVAVHYDYSITWLFERLHNVHKSTAIRGSGRMLEASTLSASACIGTFVKPPPPPNQVKPISKGKTQLAASPYSLSQDVAATPRHKPSITIFNNNI
jgi:hypothetical protein